MCNETNKRIAKLMDERGLKPFPFSKEIGVPSSTMTSIYKGNVKFDGITISNFLKIAHGLGMTAEELYYGEKPEQPSMSPSERRIVDVYRATDTRGRENIESAINREARYMDESALKEKRDA